MSTGNDYQPDAADAVTPEEIAPQEPVTEYESPPYAPMAAPSGDAARRGPREGPNAQFASQSSRVTALAVNSQLTVWRKTTGDTPVDEGLRVVVEPRNAKDRSCLHGASSPLP